MTATAPTRSTFYQSQLAYLWSQIHPGEPVPRVSDTLARELVQSSMTCYDQGACGRCGAFGRLFMTVDRVLSGDRPVLGNVRACGGCSFGIDEAKARLRRKRKVGHKGNSQYERHSPGLFALASVWPTPVANDDNKSPAAHLAMKARMKGGPRSAITSLQVLIQLWQTPSVADTMGGHLSRSKDRSGELLLKGQVKAFSRPDQTMLPHGGSGQVLSPRFVEALMGWPQTWASPAISVTTSYVSWEMASSRLLRRLLSAFFGVGSRGGEG